MAHKNHFSGNCIHGKTGAKIVNGVLSSPDCKWCQVMLATKEAKK